MITRLISLFKRRPISEDDPGVDPKKSKINDEIQLCSNCPFRGKCEWPEGCSSLKQVLKQRAAVVTRLRGNAAPDVGSFGRKPTNTHKQLWPLTGIGWRIQLGHNMHKIVRVVKVDEATDTATVMTYDNNHEANTRQEYQVKIPLLEDNRGNISADLRKFKSAVKATMCEWVVR